MVQVISPLSAEYHKKGAVCNVTDAYVEVNDTRNSKVRHVSVVPQLRNQQFCIVYGATMVFGGRQRVEAYSGRRPKQGSQNCFI